MMYVNAKYGGRFSCGFPRPDEPVFEEEFNEAFVPPSYLGSLYTPLAVE